MKKFLILANTTKDEGLKLSLSIKEYLMSKSASAVIVSDVNSHYDGIHIKEEYMDGIEAVIVLGGDGTMLRAASGIGEHDVPLVGVNLGTLGFLSEIEKNNIHDALDRLLEDDFTIEKRMMIMGTVNDQTFHSLNDIVITRAGFSRIIGLNVYLNGQLLDTYEADGVIVSTPTGSTGYNLSAGGPIVSPKSKAIVVTPISPHSLTSKSVVFDSQDKISIEIVKKHKTQETEAIVSFDGSESIPLSAGDVVYASVSPKELRLIKMYDVNFYSVLREKIGGS